MTTIAVIDGQGGGVGKALVERIRAAFGSEVRILGLGASSLASSLMLKAGADEAATGENAIVVNAPRVDVIMGALGIVAANSMLGELTPAMARAIGDSNAVKLLLPLNRCGLQVVGVRAMSFSALMDEAIVMLQSILAGEK